MFVFEDHAGFDYFGATHCQSNRGPFYGDDDMDVSINAETSQHVISGKSLKVKSIALCVLVAFISASSCTANRTHPIHTSLPQEKVQDIKVGDTVKIETYGGEHYKFKVENLSEEAIEGEGHRILLTEIERIEEVHFTGRKVAAAVGIIALLLLLVWLGSNSESPGDSSDSGESAK